MWFEKKSPLKVNKKGKPVAPKHEEVSIKKEAEKITSKSKIKPKNIEPIPDEEIEEQEPEPENYEVKCDICKDIITSCYQCHKIFGNKDKVVCSDGTHFCSDKCHDNYKNRFITPLEKIQEQYQQQEPEPEPEPEQPIADPNPNSAIEILSLDDLMWRINNNNWDNLNYIGEYIYKLFKEPYPNYEYILTMLHDKEGVDNKIISYLRNRQQELWKERELGFMSTHPEWSFRQGNNGIEDNRSGYFTLTNELIPEARAPAVFERTEYPLYIETLKLKAMAQKRGESIVTFYIQQKYSDVTSVPEQHSESSLLLPEEAELIKHAPPTLNKGLLLRDIDGNSFFIYFYNGVLYKASS